MADDHEDYETGAAPAAHKVSHQDGGSDEISVSGLSGVTEALLAHSLIATAHQDAPGLIETHRLVAGAHHTKYTDVNSRAAISNIFGSDGKADADIDLDGHKIGVEGTWTPQKVGFTEAGGGSYTLTGYYIKVGTLVWINVFINCIGTATIASLGGVTSYLLNLPFPANAAYQAVINTINSYTMVSYGQALVTGDNIFPDAWGPTGAGQGVVFSGCYRV